MNVNVFGMYGVNMNNETGIRFGVIYAQELDFDVVWDAMYGNMVWDAPEEPVPEDEDEAYMCNDDEGTGTYTDEKLGLKIRLDYLGGVPMLTVLMSPYTRKCSLCSPCVPNAGNLTDEGDYDTYDVPPDWYKEKM